ncbi:hypothetical protein [Streptomyces sp. NBC_00162]|uniref:hypothetical protein n=1 Tax=Streptomyces sp. NBC_00162 TaxID=2903629 RepID=UPI00214BC07D|nr:hypothetical protein [Streptomyces sp. NBC_00162]UUU38449.1 hypothetical protein JIW86_06130 [Streptomyces sp. NBC_00162]
MTAPKNHMVHASRSLFAGLEVCQVAGLELKPEAPGARFDDDLWDLSGLAGAPKYLARFRLRWDFSIIVDPVWRVVAKELVLSLLAPTDERVAVLPDAFRTPKAISGMYDTVQHLASWLNWLSADGVRTLTDVGQEHCDRYLALVTPRVRGDGNRSPATVINHIVPVQYLAMYRELFTHDAYAPAFQPWGGRTAADVTGWKPSQGNKVVPVPDHVLQPLLSAALWIVETIGPHVAEEIERNDARMAAKPTMIQGHNLTDQEKYRFSAHIGNYVRDDVPLPRMARKDSARRVSANGWSPSDPLLEVHLDHLIREGANQRVMNEEQRAFFRPLLEDAVAKVGVQDIIGRQAAMVQRADKAGTVPCMLPLDHDQLRHLGRVVQHACMLITSTVSGMKASELAELTEDSCLPPTPACSGAMRYRLASRVIKGQEFGGLPEEWVVIEEAWKAVALGAQIARRSGALHGAVFGMKTLNTSLAYRNFRDWVNGPEGARLGLTPIPDGPVNARMLRRTLSMALAYRPGGMIAAKIHLKHVQVATTEGYAHRPGGAQGIFLAEVGEQETEHHMELTAAAFRDFQAGIMPSGPGARDVIATFTHVDAALKDHSAGEPKTMDSDRQLVNLLRHQAQYLHVGTANYCWFKDPHKALCLKIAGTEITADSKPMAGLCDSSRCPQATYHPCHRPVWADNAQKTKVFLGSIPRAHKDARDRVRADLDRTVRVLEEIDAAAGTGTAKGQ